jgi:quercetin dioxygenase-like cupin family protein
MNSHPVCRGHEAEALEFPWGRVAFTASGSIGNSSTMSLARVTMRPGQEPNRHRHPNCDELLHVVSGTIEHSLGELLFTLEPGDTISLPAGIWHGARVLGAAPAELVICFSSADRKTEFEQ